MEVVALDQRGPLEADQCREASGIVVFLRRRDDVFPGRAIGGVAGLVIECLGYFALREVRDHVEHRFRGSLATRIEGGIQLPTVGILHDVGLSCEDVGNHAQAVGMVSDGQKVEGSPQLHRLSGVRDHLLAPSKTVGITGHEARPATASIGGKSGVHVGIAEIDFGGETAIRVGRVGAALKGVGSQPGTVLRNGETAGYGEQGGEEDSRKLHGYFRRKRFFLERTVY